MYKNKNYSNNEVIHVQDGEVEYLKFKALEPYKEKIKCVVTLRHGGKSHGVYDSLNFRILGKDSKENVYKNIDIISEKIGVDGKYICKGKQDHTDNILLLDENNMSDYAFEKQSCQNIDGYITGSNKLATLVTTADCNAIVIYDTKNNVVANLHSGWKGTTKRIYLKAIDMMKEKFESDEKDLIVCISPSVLSCCFSSEDEKFKKIFTDIWDYENEYVTYEENSKRFHIDLLYVIQKDLIKSGVLKENIHMANICTCCNDKDFYSYRSKTMKKEEDYGCMAIIVKLI